MTKPKANPRKAGRPKGAQNRLTQAEKRKALARGLSILEIWTDMANYNYRRWKREADKKVPDVDALKAKQEAVIEVGKELAPYLHPKAPAAIQHSGPKGGPIQFLDLSNLTDEQLAALEPVIATLAAAGGIAGADQGGEGSAST